VPLRVEHPVWMMLFLVLTSVTFSPRRFHHRHLGGRFREASGHTAPYHHAIDVSPVGELLIQSNMASRLLQTVSLFNQWFYLVRPLFVLDVF